MTELSKSTAKKPQADLVLRGAREVLTCVPAGDDPIGRRDNTVVAIGGEKIIALGSESEVANTIDLSTAESVDVSSMILAPGFVDCHTHLVFGGSRVKEYAARMTMDTESIQALGIPTGILATMAMTRAASVEELTTLGLDRIGRMLRHGTTTVESKTGYGLNLESELKMLDVNRRLQEESTLDVVSTFLGAHDFPPEVSRDRYVDLIIKEMIPAAAESGNTKFNDVYCDEGYYTVEQTRRILEAGMDAGLKPKVHLDAYANIGGAEMAAELKIISADHLNFTSPASMPKLANAGVIGVVMPGLDFAVGHPHPFDARLMIDQGMTLALATDMCPACWIESMQLVMALACRLYRFTPEEALLAATCHAAKAVDLDHDRGSLELGKLADIQIWDLPSFEDLIYRIGNNAVVGVIKRGHLVWF
ncbi:MAG: imidazolonepropionase [Anaerolineales bacterium]